MNPIPVPDDRNTNEQGRSGRKVYLGLDYYQGAFALLHEELDRSDFDPQAPHPIRQRFWGLLPRRAYTPIESRPLLLEYIDCVEDELARTIKRNSLAYWLHLYRRLFPGPIGTDTRPIVVGEVRSTLEAAIQKYATFHPCNRIGMSSRISPSQVLGGLLMAPTFEHERSLLQDQDQLVLTDFTVVELRRFYDVEKLAYELWRGGAMLRTTSKGAPIVVCDSPACVFSAPSQATEQLISSFDSRVSTWSYWLLSATGVVSNLFESDLSELGIVYFPTYNTHCVRVDNLEPFSSLFDVEFANPWVSNFIWVPFNLRHYREGHLPFAVAFGAEHGIDLDAILLVIAALCLYIINAWIESEQPIYVRHWQRAYQGPYIREYVFDVIHTLSTLSARLLDIDENRLADLDIPGAVQFLKLSPTKRSQIDLAYPGPHSIFLPYGDDRLFIDYAWISRYLYDLFVGVNIPDQNFKGAALERLVRSGHSILPTGPCKATDGTKKQIDAAFAIGSRLVIVECRAVAKAIGFDRGDPRAIHYRQNLVNKALNDIDAKARWLAEHPVGTNYDIRRYRDILPVAVTPFVEYIPALHSHYWLTDELPRVLTPGELDRALQNGILASLSDSVIRIER